MSLISFPYRDIDFSINNITIFIEQSFSDFGDADAVLLSDNSDVKQSLFVEAKVKTYYRRSWLIEDEYCRFEEGVRKNEISSSNLFVQLYAKSRLFSGLKRGGIELLQKGVTFPSCSSKKIRKIGNNEVVLRAVEKLMKYADEAFYVALVPDNYSNANDFFIHKFKDTKPHGFKEWNLENWGYITWNYIEEFCQKNNLEKTLEVFDFNKGQILSNNVY